MGMKLGSRPDGVEAPGLWLNDSGRSLEQRKRRGLSRLQGPPTQQRRRRRGGVCRHPPLPLRKGLEAVVIGVAKLVPQVQRGLHFLETHLRKHRGGTYPCEHSGVHRHPPLLTKSNWFGAPG